MDTFNQANAKVHSVESQWHHPILTAHGFTPVTKEATGFVRSYVYENAVGRKIKCTTGASCDYWHDEQTDKQGMWAELESYVEAIKPRSVTT